MYYTPTFIEKSGRILPTLFGLFKCTYKYTLSIHQRVKPLPELFQNTKHTIKQYILVKKWKNGAI